MTIPKSYEMYPELIRCLSDGQLHPVHELRMRCSEMLGLTEAEYNRRTPKGNKTVYNDRFNWAATNLRKAGLIASPSKGMFILTELGKKAADHGPEKIDTDYLMQFESYRDFISPGRAESKADMHVNDGLEPSPEHEMQKTVDELNRAISAELMKRIRQMTPYEFRKLVSNLLKRMDYNVLEVHPELKVTEDRFGLDRVGVLTKEYSNTAVDEPELKEFVKSMNGMGVSKGLVFTADTFTTTAYAYAADCDTMNLALVDKDELTALMIEHDIGVIPYRRYEIKRIDWEFFN